MKSNAGRIFWGVALLLTGAYFLARDLGVAPDLSENAWVMGLSVVSLAFFVLYIFSRFQDWGLLFPAFGAGAVAAMIWLSESGYNESGLGTIILWGVAVPFWVAFITHRKENSWTAIPAWALTVIGVIVLIADTFAEDYIGAFVMFSIALPFIVAYLRNRTRWGLLIPGYVLTVIGLIVLFESAVDGEFIGAFVMFSISFPFVVVYFRNRNNWWALIPAGVLSLIGGIVFLDAASIGADLLGGVILSGLALLFLFIYLRWRERWWAIIPAGILLSSAATVFLTLLTLPEATAERVYGGVMLGGTALTFSVLWMLRDKHATSWAIYPAAGLGVYALVVVILGSKVAWPLALISTGVWLVYRNVSQRKTA